MKIGVISDTHIMRSGRMLPNQIYEVFDGVDMILHAGDILIEDVITELETIAPVHVVAGNNDGFEILMKYGKRKIIKAGNKRIGLTHGTSYHGGGRGKTYQSAYAEFLNDDLDCIVYGHSHVPHNEVIDDILFFNPGSPTNRRFQPRYSLGVLYVEDDIRGEIIYFD